MGMTSASDRVNDSVNIGSAGSPDHELKEGTFELGYEQKTILEILQGPANQMVFVTGGAGTGKSFLLKAFVRQLTSNFAVVAPTGIAAINVGGATLHAYFGLKPDDDIFCPKTSKVHASQKGRLTHLDVLIIDEVSMVRSDYMETMSHKLQKAKGVKQPFGGVKVVMFGDPYQLPPVVKGEALEAYLKKEYGGRHFFHAPVIREGIKDGDFQIYELKENFRQNDSIFETLLNEARLGEASADTIRRFNKRVRPYPVRENIMLETNNIAARFHNRTELNKLVGEEFSFPAQIIWGKRPWKKWDLPMEENLVLKSGAKVMMIKNDKEDRWVNGTIAQIHHVDKKRIDVKIDDDIHSVRRERWDEYNYWYNPATQRLEAVKTSTIEQFPIKLAWAITIHKSQGSTYLSSVTINIAGGAFDAGQTYVALSRCKDINKLYLKKPLKQKNIYADKEVVKFMKNAKIVPVNKVPEIARIRPDSLVKLEISQEGIEPRMAAYRLVCDGDVGLPLEGYKDLNLDSAIGRAVNMKCLGDTVDMITDRGIQQTVKILELH